MNRNVTWRFIALIAPQIFVRRELGRNWVFRRSDIHVVPDTESPATDRRSAIWMICTTSIFPTMMSHLPAFRCAAATMSFPANVDEDQVRALPAGS